MGAPAFTPWKANVARLSDGSICVAHVVDALGSSVAQVSVYDEQRTLTNTHMLAAAPDHALICWAMCVQDATWEEWTPFDGSGEFVFAGLRYATRLDEFGCPKLTPALRVAIAASRAKSAEIDARARGETADA